MITVYFLKNHVAVSHLFVQGLRAHANIMHAWDSLGVEGGWDDRVDGIFFLVVLVGCVINTHLMSTKDVQEIFASFVAPVKSMWANHAGMLFTGPDTYAGIDIWANHNHCIGVDGVQHGVEGGTELFMFRSMS
jgi:hypothetical protein